MFILSKSLKNRVINQVLKTCLRLYTFVKFFPLIYFQQSLKLFDVFISENKSKSRVQSIEEAETEFRQKEEARPVYCLVYLSHVLCLSLLRLKSKLCYIKEIYIKLVELESTETRLVMHL